MKRQRHPNNTQVKATEYQTQEREMPNHAIVCQNAKCYTECSSEDSNSAANLFFHFPYLSEYISEFKCSGATSSTLCTASSSWLHDGSFSLRGMRIYLIDI